MAVYVCIYTTAVNVRVYVDMSSQEYDAYDIVFVYVYVCEQQCLFEIVYVYTSTCMCITDVQEGRVCWVYAYGIIVCQYMFTYRRSVSEYRYGSALQYLCVCGYEEYVYGSSVVYVCICILQ